MPEVEGSWYLHSIGFTFPCLANPRAPLCLIVLTLHLLIQAYAAQLSLNICLMHTQGRQLLVEQGRFSSRGQLQVTTQTPPAGEVGLFDIRRTPGCCVATHEQAIYIFAIAINSEELAIARESRFPCSCLA